MCKKHFKFEVGEEVLNRHGLKVFISERQVNNQFGHNEYRLKDDNLRVWHTEKAFKPSN